jgi:hypothetical protein
MRGNMPPISLPAPTLQTARLRLRPFNDADPNALFALHSSAYVLRYWGAPPWSERVRAERFIMARRQMAEEGTGTRLAACRRWRESPNGHVRRCTESTTPGRPQQQRQPLPARQADASFAPASVRARRHHPELSRFVGGLGAGRRPELAGALNWRDQCVGLP